jgi:peptide/nickel transport system permease protein
MIPRLLARAAVLLLVVIGTRGALRVIPGDPLDLLLDETGISLSREVMAADLGLDRPFLRSLLDDVPRYLSGNWGYSFISREPVLPTILSRFGTTVKITGLALLLAIPTSLLLSGRSSAGNPRVLPAFTTLLTAAVPLPWLGILNTFLFSLWLPFFEISGSLFLAALTLAAGSVGLWSRLITQRVTDELETPATLAGRARGLSERRIRWAFGLRPALPGLLAYLGSQIGHLLTGSFVVEALFDCPGMGTLFIESVLKRDLPVVEGCVWLSTLTTLTLSAAGDTAQRLLDPRFEGGGQEAGT